MQYRSTFVFLAGLALTSCAPLEGPPLNLATVATPDPVPELVRPLPVVPSEAPPTQKIFRAWIPRQVSRDGEVTDGHWQTLSLAPPVLEVIEPDKSIPRAPKYPTVKPVQVQGKHGPSPALVAPLPQAQPSPLPAAFPKGLTIPPAM